MAKDDDHDVQRQLLRVLLDKIQDEKFPSPTTLDLIEELLQPADVQRYARVLLDKVAEDPYPSLDHVRRLQVLG